MKNNYKVYKHTSPNDKVYIGITCQNPIDRWCNGKGYIGNNHFTNAINKYGWNNFKHEILFENLSKEEACQKEIELIKEYKSNNPEFGYNITGGGEGISDYHHTEETKKLIGLYSKLRMNDDYYKENFRQKRIGHITSEETRYKMSISKKGKPTWNKGKKLQPLSIEHKQNISNSLKGKMSGDKNPMYGKTPWNKGLAMPKRIWVNNQIENKLIKVENLDIFLKNGYMKGRKK